MGPNIGATASGVPDTHFSLQTRGRCQAPEFPLRWRSVCVELPVLKLAPHRRAFLARMMVKEDVKLLCAQRGRAAMRVGSRQLKE